MNSYGVILRKLREINQQPLKQAAKSIGRSAGWLSGIENGRGNARIRPEEFEQIVNSYNGQTYRKQFGAWITQAKKSMASKKVISFDGAILRYLREKKKMSLKQAAKSIGFSGTHLCNLEKGKRSLNLQIRDQLLSVYGYSPSSFRNFTTEDKRSKNIPARYKLEILLNHQTPQEIETVFNNALDVKLKSSSEILGGEYEGNN